ncbi:MAG TPA: TonB-dependent receptor [Povalibacter sp.]|uniref:TonB-dependent receptor n=1 Tax=Povalibacter sp. TaxID=1962978 RepID=UPI002C0ADABB|nr:TonB-dependent receptor [Povalibacter sp.]HMN46434.1 TonB-dependent receptor [Povalibacter sp.]
MPIEEIVVTAQKRSESLNEVPISVSAFDAERRTILGLQTTQDIANFTPGMAMSDTPNRVWIRGVGRATNEVGSDPGVAQYVDGFYTSESDVIGSSDFNTERIEVLRGPQGTLYGRNSIGGAVNVVSIRPSEAFETSARLGYGEYERANVQLAVSGPISDAFRYRLSGTLVDQGEGYIRNLSGEDQWTTDIKSIEAQFEADLTSDIKWWLKLATTSYDYRPRPYSAIDERDITTPHGGLVPNPTYQYPDNPSLNDPYVVDYDFSGHQELSNHVLVTTQLDWDFGGFSLRYIGGYSQYDYSFDRDLDQTPRTSAAFPGFGTTWDVSTDYREVVEENKTWDSHEINLLSEAGGSFDWIAGLYYYHETLDQPYWQTAPGIALLETPVGGTYDNPMRAYYYQRGELESHSYAAFVRPTWHLSPAWDLSVGVRYTYDEKSGSEEGYRVFYNPAVDPFNAYDAAPAVASPRAIEDSWDAVTGDLNLSYHPSDDTLLYLTASKGYKSGGFKLGGLAEDPQVDPEEIHAFEIGWKQAFLDGVLQWNNSLFYYDYSDLQVLFQYEPTPGVTQTQFVNAPKSHSQGWETELEYRPTSDLTMRLVYSYLQAEFDEFSGVADISSPNASALQDLKGNTLPQSPENKVGAAISYALGDVTLSATYSFVDEQYYGIFNTDRYRAPSYEVVGVRAVWDANAHTRAVLGVSNLLDEEGYTQVTPSTFASGAVRRVQPLAPRIVSAEIQFKF